jgi:hypothetical protein
MADAKNPPSFHDAIANAAQAIAGSINAPDYDPKFAGLIIDVMHKFVSQPKPGQGQPPAGAGPSPAGGPPSPADAGGSPGGAPGGVGAPPGAGGPGGSPQPGSGAQTPPAAPTPGGITQGLTPSPDELRRVLADVAGK